MLVFNPVAGQSEAFERELLAAASVWREAGWSVQMEPTLAAGDGRRLGRLAAAEGFDLVVAAGGDGTLNEVLNGLAGSSTALAPLPLGTMNVWARELNLPLQPRAAAEALLSWRPHSIDLGRAGERYFLLMAGIGFDAAITADVRLAQKRRLGALAYVITGLRRAWNVRGSRVRLLLDGQQLRRRVIQLVLGNTRLYGGLVTITHQASIDDGLLDVCVIMGDNGLSAIRRVIAIIGRRQSQDRAIEYYRARSVHVFARPRLPVQVDGDPIGRTPMEFEVAPGTLRALLPRELPAGLVRQSPSEMLRSRAQGLADWLTRR